MARMASYYGKRATEKQKIEIELAGLHPSRWHVDSETDKTIVLIGKDSGKRRTIQKGAWRKWE